MGAKLRFVFQLDSAGSEEQMHLDPLEVRTFEMTLDVEGTGFSEADLEEVLVGRFDQIKEIIRQQCPTCAGYPHPHGGPECPTCGSN